MEDLLLELLAWILEPLLEALFDYLVAGFVDLILRSMGEMSKGQQPGTRRWPRWVI